MKNKNVFSKREIKIKSIVAIILLLFLILSFFFANQIENVIGLKRIYFEHEISEIELEKSNFKIVYLDVKQGNSTYVKLPDGKILLIDGGNLESGSKIVKTLKKEGIEQIDYLIATHADSDHIGGLLNVLDSFEIKNIFRPFQIAGIGTNYENFVVDENEDLFKVYNNLVKKYGEKSKISRVNSSIYIDFIKKIYNEQYTFDKSLKNAIVTVFYDGLKISGENYEIEFFSPFVRNDNIELITQSNTYGYATVGYGVNNSNDNSAIFSLTIFEKIFLFTGDASWTSKNETNISFGKYEEMDFVLSLTQDEKDKLSNISVYLVGHHGSVYSSSDDLLSIITPKFCVISVEDDNSYDHPSVKTLDRLNVYKEYEDYILMTKDYGNITFGLINDEICYYLEKSEKADDLIISWYLLSTIIYLFVVYIIFSIKVKNKKVNKKKI